MTRVNHQHKPPIPGANLEWVAPEVGHKVIHSQTLLSDVPCIPEHAQTIPNQNHMALVPKRARWTQIWRGQLLKQRKPVRQSGFALW